MVGKIISFYKTGPNKPLLDNSADIKKNYERKRISVTWALLIGYSFFYTCKVNLGVVKKPLLDAGILDVKQMGLIGAILLYTYGIGKFTNGFLADRANVRKIISTGLMISALVNLIFGLTTNFFIFAILWGINGWFQSMGSAPSVVSICQWFSNNERGTRYGLWAGAHNLGEGITFVGTSALVAWFGWRIGFIAPGLVCIVVALLLMIFLADRPQTYGLPHVADYRQDYSGGKPSHEKESVGRLQIMVLKSPVVWILCLSSALMYMARYAINNWVILFLQEAKGVPLIKASVVMIPYTICGLTGALLSGFISDRFFHSRRNLPALIYALIEIAGMVLLFLVPPGYHWIDSIAMGMFGFGIGGLIVFLAGLMAVDVCPKRAVGAVKGIIGLCSYIGAGCQDWISGLLIDKGEIVIDGVTTHNFSYAFYFWIGTSVLSMLLTLTLWKVKPQE
ncbi:MAG: MFS transporter [Sedimentisphaerales bacterium]|nr:MFS transporter [Sedimentisphaerales bacterium]